MARCLLWALTGDVKWVYDMHREIYFDKSCLWLFLCVLKIHTNLYRIGQQMTIPEDSAALRYLPCVWGKPYQKIHRQVECVVLMLILRETRLYFDTFFYNCLMISVPKTDPIVIKSLRLLGPVGQNDIFKCLIIFIAEK